MFVDMNLCDFSNFSDFLNNVIFKNAIVLSNKDYEFVLGMQMNRQSSGYINCQKLSNSKIELSDLLNGGDYRRGEPCPQILECTALYYTVAHGGHELMRMGVN